MKSNRDPQNTEAVTPRLSPSLRYRTKNAASSNIPFSPRTLADRSNSPFQLTRSCQTASVVSLPSYESNSRPLCSIFSGSTSHLFSQHTPVINLPEASASTSSWNQTRCELNLSNLSHLVCNQRFLSDSQTATKLRSQTSLRCLTHQAAHPVTMSHDHREQTSLAAVLEGVVSPIRLRTDQFLLNASELKRRHLAINRVVFNQHRMRVSRELAELDDSNSPTSIIVVTSAVHLKPALVKTKDYKPSLKRVRFSSLSSLSTYSVSSPPSATKPAPDIPMLQSLSPQCYGNMKQNDLTKSINNEVIMVHQDHVVSSPALLSHNRPCTPIPTLQLGLRSNSEHHVDAEVKIIASTHSDNARPVTPSNTRKPPATVPPTRSPKSNPQSSPLFTLGSPTFLSVGYVSSKIDPYLLPACLESSTCEFRMRGSTSSIKSKKIRNKKSTTIPSRPQNESDRRIGAYKASRSRKASRSPDKGGECDGLFKTSLKKKTIRRSSPNDKVVSSTMKKSRIVGPQAGEGHELDNSVHFSMPPSTLVKPSKVSLYDGIEKTSSALSLNKILIARQSSIATSIMPLPSSFFTSASTHQGSCRPEVVLFPVLRTRKALFESRGIVRFTIDPDK